MTRRWACGTIPQHRHAPVLLAHRCDRLGQRSPLRRDRFLSAQQAAARTGWRFGHQLPESSVATGQEAVIRHGGAGRRRSRPGDHLEAVHHVLGWLLTQKVRGFLKDKLFVAGSVGEVILPFAGQPGKDL